MTDLVTELLLALELALPPDRDERALHQQLDRVEQAMSAAITTVFDPDDEPLEQAA